MSKTEEYLRSVNGAAHQSAVTIIVDLEKQLAERDAALARCVEAAKTAMMFIRAHHWKDNAPGRCVWDLDAAKSAYDSLKGANASLPASAQATAKVLAAARKLAGHIVRPSDFEALREAIREEKEGK